ncbi:MAG: proline dehydrogenase family protein, partial [Dehalococcoidia bacterium]|nr:proline dehydrogenase family protein [Dehalococcoidia bacterium]
MAEAAVEERTRAIGEELLADLERYRPRAAERMQDWLLTDALADDAFRGRMLRFIDVFATVETTGDAEELHRLLREYFPPGLPHVPRALRWLLRIARDPLLPSTALLEATRRAVALFARRFIADPDPRAMGGLLDELQSAGRLPSLDLLGEAVLSEREADAYEARYRRLLGDLAAHPLAGTATRAGDPALQVSLKLSSLTYRFTPVDLDGSVARVAPRLERIADAARAAGVGICVDAEQYETRDVVWAAWQRTFSAGGPHADWRGAGMVVQAYLRDADRHLDAVIDAAHRRGVPFQVRLVKGAYWDYET